MRRDRLYRAAVELSDFAWSAVTADCEEARVYLNSLVLELRAGIEDADGGPIKGRPSVMLGTLPKAGPLEPPEPKEKSR
jgi:hypothetical protein